MPFDMGVLLGRYDALLDERAESRFLMPSGMFFVVMGGWLLS